jgi:hypothetical protein
LEIWIAELNSIGKKNRGTSSIQLNILILQLTVGGGREGTGIRVSYKEQGFIIRHCCARFLGCNGYRVALVELVQWMKRVELVERLE